MFNAHLLLDSIPDVWQDYFKDKDFLKSLYAFIGTELSDDYASILREPASLGIDYIPLKTYKTWDLIQLDVTSRVELIDSLGAPGLVLYGIIVREGFVENCSRIYPAPRIDKDFYLSKGIDFEILTSDSQEVIDLISRSKTPSRARNKRFTHYILFKAEDPLVTNRWQKEPATDTVGIPAAFRINTRDITAGEKTQVINASVLNATDGAEIYKLSVLGVVDNIDHLLVMLLKSDILEDRDKRNLKLVDITSTVHVRIDQVYNSSLEIANVWGFNCQVDTFELSNKFGWLWSDKNPVIRSTPQYRALLIILKKIKLQGLTATDLYRLINVFLSSEIMLLPSAGDLPIELNLLNHKLRTNTSIYTVNTKAQFSKPVLSNVLSYTGEFGSKNRADCVFLKLSSNYLLALTYLIQGGNLVVTNATGTTVLTIFAAIEDTTFIGFTSSTALDMNSSIRIYLTSSIYVTLPSGDFITEAIVPQEYTEDTTINHYINVWDINNYVEWWKKRTPSIPKYVWNTSSGRRRTVTENTWPFTIGSMPLHRVGDYSLNIPTTANTTTEETGLKLFRDFLQNKTALVEYSNNANIVTGQRIDHFLAFVGRFRNLGNLILTTNSFDVVDMVTAGNDVIDVVVAPSPSVFQDLFKLTDSLGIGSSVILAVLKCSNANHGLVINTAVTIYSTVSKVLAVDGAMVLIDITGNLPAGSNLTSLPNSITIISNNQVVSIIPAESYFTNVVGIPEEYALNRRMVVGNSYPEYPLLYPHPATTIGEHLDIAIT